MTDHDALTAYRAAIAATDAARRQWSPTREHHLRQELIQGWELTCGRAYLAARDASVAGQVTCGEAGPGVADFEEGKR